MNWNNLKNMKCPKCNSILTKGTSFVTCPGCKDGGFMCGNEKFDGIVSSLYHSQKTVDMRKNAIDENLETLNNFGHKPITQDFSDSPFLDL